MAHWKKSDIGKIIVYKSLSEFCNELKDEKIVIYGVNDKVPNTIGFIEYPISLKSNIGKVGIIKDQEKKSERYLEKVGDWCFMGNVSKDEMEELERIAKAPKAQAYEDLSPQCTFH